MRTSSEPQFGALREVAVRERQGALSRRASQRSIGWVRTRFGEDGGKLDRRRAREVLNPCARESKARTERLLTEKLMYGHGMFSSYEGQQGVASVKDLWVFSRHMHRAFWTAGFWLAHRLHQLKASTTMDLGISISLFLHDVWP